MRRFRRKTSVTSDQVKTEEPYDSRRRDGTGQEGGTEQPNTWDLRLSARLSYLGCMRVPEAKSLQRLYEITKQLKERERQEKRSKQVVFELHALHIVVVDAVSAAPDLSIPLVCISMCANDKAKAVANCFGIIATASPGVHECHVFQCQTSKEVENIVQNVALGFKLLGRTRRPSDPDCNPSPVPSPIIRGNTSMQKISENSVASHVSISPRPSSGATSLSSYLSSSSSNINRLSDQSSLLEVETRSGSINVDVDASSLILPRDDAFEKELNLRVDKIVADRERLKLLCRAGDPSVIPDESAGYISAVVAIGSNDVSGLQRLLDGGLSVNDCDSLGRSLLHLATACGNEDAVRVLVERNGNVDVGDKDEITPLHMAAAAGDKQTVQLLINSGANVNVTDTAYRLPLHYCACMCGPDSAQMGDFVQCCYVLLESGAQIDVNDLNGVRPVDVFKDLSEMRSRLIESACEGLASMTEIRLSVYSDGEQTGTATPIADLESNLSTAFSTLDRGRNKRLSADSSATCLTSSSANTLKRSPTDNGLASTPVNLSRPLSARPDLDSVSMHSDMRSDKVQLKPTSDSCQLAAMAPAAPDLTEGLDQETKAAFKELDDVVLQSTSNIADNGDEDGAEDMARVRSETTIEDYFATPLLSTPDGTFCNTRIQSEDDLLAKSVPNSRSSSLDRDRDTAPGRNGAVRPVSMFSSVTNNSSPSSEATVTPESSVWNTLDSAYRSHNRDAALVRIRDSEEQRLGGTRNRITIRDSDVDSQFDGHRFSIGSWTSESTCQQLSPSQRLSIVSSPTSSEMLSVSSALDSTNRNQKRSDPERPRVRSGSGETPVIVSLPSAKSLPRICETATHALNVDSVSPRVGNPNSVPGSECSSALTSSFNTLDSSYRGNRSRFPADTSLQRRLAKASKSLQRFHRSVSVTSGDNAAHEGTPQRQLSFTGDDVSLTKLSIGLSSLRLLVKLSSNRECHDALLSHLCIEKNSEDLIQLARMPVLGEHPRECIATLIHRLFEVDGSAGRQRAVSAGLFGVVLNLLDAFEPVRSSCLSIADAVLQGDEGTDYMVSVSFLDPDVLLRLIASTSFPSSARDTKLGLELSPGDPSEKSRTVALRILSIVSGYGRFRRKLVTDRAIHCLKVVIRSSGEEESVILALTALANVAMLTESHNLFTQLLVKRCLLKSLESFDAPKARYHAVRALVYLGHHEFPGLYLFSLLEACEDNTIYGDNFTEGEAHGIVRGITLERIVYMISSQKNNSWTGLALCPEPTQINKSPSKFASSDKAQSAPDNKIIDFILSTCRSFVEPPVLLRLLLHRFRDAKTIELFESGRKRARRSRAMIEPPILEPYAPLPNHQMYIMRFLELWMEKYGQDYRDYPDMRKEIKVLLKPMRRVGGPYSPCSAKLQQLCHEVKKRRSGAIDPEATYGRFSEPLHDELYTRCRKDVTSGDLPISPEQAVIFAGIQCYIDDICSSPSQGRHKVSGSSWSLFGDRTLNTKLKHCLPPDVKGKAVAKGIRIQQQQYMDQKMSERSAKHLYIKNVHDLPQYGCKFFQVREVIAPGSKMALQPRRLLGISTDKILVLDERSKEILKTFPFQSLKRWDPGRSVSALVLVLTDEQLVFSSDESGYFQRVNDHIWRCVEEVDWNNVGVIDASPWGRTAEEQGQWGSSVLVEAAKTPAAKHRASTVRDRCFSKTREDITPSSSASSSPSSSSHQTPNVTPRETPTNRTPVESCYDPFPGRTIDSVRPETVDEERVDIKDIATAVHQKLSQANTPKAENAMMSDPSSEPPRLTVTGPEDASSFPKKPTPDLLHSLEGSESSLLDRVDELQQNSLSTSSVSIEQPHSDSGVGTSSSVSRTTSFPISEVSTSSRLHSSSMISTSSVDGASSHTDMTKLCDCPPDPDLSPDFDLHNITLMSLLQHPKEVARQITLIDHEMFRGVTVADCLHKVNSVVSKVERETVAGQRSVEKFAHRFNQMSNWVMVSILSQDSHEQRAVILSHMIQVARQCLHYRNFNGVVAIVVAGLGSSPIRRLKKTWEALEKNTLDLFLKMDHLVRYKNNYKNYRHYLRATQPPAVPYFGLYLKDLTFIADGNPDCLRGGLINLTKRRLIFTVLSELYTFQNSKYNFRRVPAIAEYLLSHQLTPDVQLHDRSRTLEPRGKRKTVSSTGLSSK